MDMDFSDGESIVESIFGGSAASPASSTDWSDINPASSGDWSDVKGFDMEYSYPPPVNNFADAILMGSQGISYNDMNRYDYRNDTKYNNSFCSSQCFTDSAPSSPESSQIYSSPLNSPIYSEEHQAYDFIGKESPVNICWPNSTTNRISVENNQMQENLYQQSMLYGQKFKEEERIKEVFQMSKYLDKYKQQQQQQVLMSLLKQQGYQAAITTLSEQNKTPQSPPTLEFYECYNTCASPLPLLPPSVTNQKAPLQSQTFLNQQRDIKQEVDVKETEEEKLDFLDEEMLFSVFQQLAQFVNNEDVTDIPKYSMPPETENKKATAPTALPKPKRKRIRRPNNGSANSTGKPRLYNFLIEILENPDQYPCIEWVDKKNGLFKFIDSAEVARLWGYRKNKPHMKYENFARSLRTYIAKGILTKPRNKLVYCFVKPV